MFTFKKKYFMLIIDIRLIYDTMNRTASESSLPVTFVKQSTVLLLINFNIIIW